MTRRSRRAADPIGNALRTLRPGEYAVISKRILPSLPENYEETSMGTPPSTVHPRALRQFRGPYRRHVYETPTVWIAHKDRADPRRDPLDHLLRDTPELAGALFVGGVTGVVTAQRTRAQRLAQGNSAADANRDAILSGILAGLLAGGATYVVISVLKRALR